MKRVYKFKVSVIGGPQTIELPADAKLVHARMGERVGEEGDLVYLWYEIDSGRPVRHHRFEVFPTGWDVPETHRHVVTVSALDLRLVWHVYELEEVFGG